MARIFVTAMAALSMLGLGIAALSYKQQQLASAGLTNRSAQAFNLTTNIGTGVTSIAGNAMPRLLALVILVVVVLMLLMIR